MIECPRCGFIQPSDRYCASCGLDIQNFTPKKRPLLFRIFRSPLFQASLSLAIVILFIYFLLQRQTKFVDGPPLPVLPAAQLQAQPQTQTPPVKPVSLVEDISDEPEYEELPSVTEETPPSVHSTVKLPETVDVLFFEVSKEILASLLREAHSVSVLPTLQVFNVDNEKLKILQRARELPGSAQLVPVKDSHFQFIMPARSGEVGLKFEVGQPIPHPVEQNFSTHLTAQLIGFQKSNESQPLTLRMDETVVSSPDQSIMVVGLIPNGIAIPAQPADLAKTPFAVLGSTAFQQNLNEVIFILQFH